MKKNTVTSFPGGGEYSGIVGTRRCKGLYFGFEIGDLGLFGVRNFLVELFSSLVLKKGAYLRVLNFISNNYASFIYKLNNFFFHADKKTFLKTGL